MIIDENTETQRHRVRGFAACEGMEKLCASVSPCLVSFNSQFSIFNFQFSISQRLHDGDEHQRAAEQHHQDDRSVNVFGSGQHYVAQRRPQQRYAYALRFRESASCPAHCSAFFLATMASMAATAVMLTMSRTELSKSVKWMGLFNPICIGPISSPSVCMPCRSW